MKSDDFRTMIRGGNLPTPCVIETEGGSYRVTDPKNAYISEAYPDTVLVGILEEGIVLLALDEIRSIRPDAEPPRYAAKLRALRQDGPFGPLVLTMRNGRQFPLAGPHEYLLSPNGRRVAIFDQDGGGVILETCEIADLAPGP